MNEEFLLICFLLEMKKTKLIRCFDITHKPPVEPFSSTVRAVCTSECYTMQMFDGTGRLSFI